ncbi:MAG: DUF898 domain-containing protein [Rhodocyclales bacterium]|nr:DUF898 domain-containing protein [Rhodocyclales bacterium]
MPTENNSPAAAENAPATLRFTGEAGEYFRIWIVNVCLSILTLGIYSAWAKVRRKRYFYGNTLLRDASFEYLAEPTAILKGRFIVIGILMAFGLVAELLKTNLLGLLYIVAIPYVVIKAARFNAVNSAYRGVRFSFGVGFPPQSGLAKHAIPGYTMTSQFLILPIFLVPLSLGLLYPYYAFRRRQFFFGHSAFGTTPFAFDARPGGFYLVYFKAALFFLLFLVGSVVTLGLGALPLYILFAAYRDAAVARLAWGHTRLGNMRFSCQWKTWDLFKLHLVNTLAIIATLGLMAPWAAIRVARYQLQGLSLQPADEIDGFVATETEKTAATGDEAGDLLGLDFGL